MITYDKSQYYVDFSDRDNLSNDEKTHLNQIQNSFRPIERIDSLTPYRLLGKITNDDFEKMTGVPYNAND